MAISYNTGVTGHAETSSSEAFVIPAGVLVDDVMLLSVTCFTETATPPTISLSGGGGAWTLAAMTNASANPEVAAGSSIWSYGYAYYRVATAGDPGATLTVSETGSPAATTWWGTALDSYTGASKTLPVDVAGGAQAFGSGGLSVACPALTTGVAGDWAVTLGGGGPGVGASFVGPAGQTSRQSVVSSAGVGAATYDSAGSVGGAGTSIGGGTFKTSLAGNAWLTVFTIGLAPAGASPAATRLLMASII